MAQNRHRGFGMDELKTYRYRAAFETALTLDVDGSATIEQTDPNFENRVDIIFLTPEQVRWLVETLTARKEGR
jgi:hypothetical protein